MEIAEWQRDGISEMMIPQTAQLDAGPGSRPGASGGPVTLPSAPLFRHGQKGLGQKVHSSTPKVPSCGRRLAFIKNRLRHATPASRRVKSSNFSHSGNNATPQSRDQWHKKHSTYFQCCTVVLDASQTACFHLLDISGHCGSFHYVIRVLRWADIVSGSRKSPPGFKGALITKLQKAQNKRSHLLATRQQQDAARVGHLRETPFWSLSTQTTHHKACTSPPWPAAPFVGLLTAIVGISLLDATPKSRTHAAVGNVAIVRNLGALLSHVTRPVHSHKVVKWRKKPSGGRC